MSVTIDKVHESAAEPTCFTFGGRAAYHAEINAYLERGYTRTEHSVLDREGAPFTIEALYAGGVLAKVYEL